jgi:hypothetical protein
VPVKRALFLLNAALAIAILHDKYPTYSKIRKANWTGHRLGVNCLLKYVIEGKTGGRIKVIGSGGRRRKQLLVDFKEK